MKTSRRQSRPKAAGRNGAAPAARTPPADEARQLRFEVAALREKIERLQADQFDLERSRERFAELYLASPVSRLVLTGGGQVTDANFAVAHILGHVREAIIGKPFSLFVTLSDRTRLQQALLDVIVSRAAVRAELDLLHRDGTIVPVQFIAARLEGTRASRQPEFHVALVSLADLRMSEKRLRESEERLRQAVAAADAGTWEVDLATGVVIPSERFRDLMGLEGSGHTITVTDLISRFGANQRARMRRHFDRVFRGELKSFAGDFRILHPRAGLRWLGMHGQLVRDAQGVQRLMGIAMDITPRKKIEAQLRIARQNLSQRVKERTAELRAANTSLELEAQERRKLEREVLRVSEHEQMRIGADLHDGLGQQVTGAMLLNSLLQESLDRESHVEAASARRISELLSAAKEQIRGIVRGLNPVATEPNGLMVALENLAAGVRGLHAVDCRFDASHPVLLADNVAATHLFRIAQEAVNNATRHARAKQIVLSLVHSNHTIVLEVRDDGRGIGKSNGATGVGLRTMRYRAEAMGGAFEVRPLGRRGTLVRCIVPDGAIQLAPLME